MPGSNSPDWMKRRRISPSSPIASTAQGHGLGRHTMPEMIDYSAVTAVHTIWLAARAQGIGMGWVSILDPKAVAAILDVPEDWKFIGYFCLGYPQADDTVPELERAGWEAAAPAALDHHPALSMTPKSGHRFSEKVMRNKSKHHGAI